MIVTDAFVKTKSNKTLFCSSPGPGVIKRRRAHFDLSLTSV